MSLVDVSAVVVAASVLVGWSPRPPRRLRRRRTPACSPRARPGEVARAIGARTAGLLGLEPEPGRDRRTGTVLVAAVVLAPLGPLVAATGAALTAVAGIRRSRERRRARTDEIRAALPDVVDLLTTAVGAGLSVTAAVAAVAELSAEPVADRLGRAVRAPAGPVEGLAGVIAELGEPVRPLVRVLSDGIRHGAPVAVGLERVAVEARLVRRRQAEERARRTGVRLVFPLVLCLLPAFALLTVAPVLISSLDLVVG